jgi:hypothetical protein
VGRVKTTPVSVYIGDEPVGSGSLAYDDKIAHSLIPYTARHCDETPVYIGSGVVPLQFCWDDTVTGWYGGTAKRVVDVPVYVGESEVGRASIEVEDSFGMSILIPLLVLLMMITIITAVVELAGASRREKGVKA